MRDRLHTLMDEDILFEDMERQAREDFLFASLMEQDLKNRKEKVAPDTTSAESLFLTDFLTYDMEYDFMTIVREFVSTKMKDFPDYASVFWADSDEAKRSTPDKAARIRILSLIYAAAKTGDSYSICLIKYLYKTYYKREYNQLKRFTRISGMEVCELARSGSGKVSFYTMSRILVMCGFFGIELDVGCSALYLLIDAKKKEGDSQDEEKFRYLELPDGLFSDCCETVEGWLNQYNSRRRKHKVFYKEQRFVETCLSYVGYDTNYVNELALDADAFPQIYGRTLALLKTAFPNEEFTLEDVQHYAMSALFVDIIENLSEREDEDYLELFGLLSQRYQGEDKEEFHLSDKMKLPIDIGTRKEKTVKPVIITKKSEEEAKEEYLSEIEALRQKVRRQEQEIRYLQDRNHGLSRDKKNAEDIIRQYDSERKELIALREYVYNLSEDFKEPTNVDISEMRKALEEKKVLIIGGHINWHNKIREIFPGWVLINPNAHKSVSPKVLDGIEQVYFFCDYIDHGTYYKFIGDVRERNIPFGYLHQVHINTMITRIYGDLITDDEI